MKTILALSFLLFSNMVFAHDSTWKLCMGPAVLFDAPEKLVVSVYEHRSDADKRQTDLTLIFGGFTLIGALDTTDSDEGHVRLSMGRYSFDGIVKIDWPTSTIILNGDLDLGSKTIVNSILSCKVLRD